MGRWLKRAAEIAAQDSGRRIIELVPSDENPEIAWRVAAMRPQVPMRGPIPFLVARAFAWSLEDVWAVVNARASPRCLSCGDPVEGARQACCSPCQHAAYIVVNSVRESLREEEA